MGITVYGRRAIRRFERETGEQIVHAAGPYLTTIDHRHLIWTGERWSELESSHAGSCGLPTRLSSCSKLFGYGGHYRGFMRGPCRDCDADCGQLHYWDCPTLDEILDWRSINPDYWPRPVHRPRWLDDPRCPSTTFTLTARLAYTMDVPLELLITGADRNHWSGWEPEWAAGRHACNEAVAAVAPQLLRQAGLDPARYTLAYEENSP